MATIITDATGLDDVRNDLAGDYVLGADIDLSSVPNWVPIGDSTTPFTGTLDFSGYSISGLTISRDTTDYVGLFGYCRFNDALKIPNIKGGTVNGTVAGQDYVGLLAGYVETTLGATGDALSDPVVGKLVDDITGTGTVDGRSKVGGLIGMVKGPQFAGHADKTNIGQTTVFEEWIARLEGIASSVAVTGSGTNIGGVIGESYEITVNLSNTTGAITGGDVVGGIVGYGYRCAELDCYSTGNITGTKLVGGIIGSGSFRSRVRRCWSEGNITGTGGIYPGQVSAQTAGVGGIAGYINLDFINDCYSLGDITAVYRAGGLVGACNGMEYSSPNFYRCYAQGDIAVSGSQVGGLVGFMFSEGYVEFDQCYCTGSVAGSLSGALIGVRGSYIEYGEDYAIVNPNWDQVQGTVVYMSDCFYNSDVNTASNQYGGVPKTDAEMRLDVTYETSADPWEWYDYYWVIDDEEGDYYPQLRCFYDPYGLAIGLIRGAGGLTLSYLKEGGLYHKELNAGSWSNEMQVPGISNAQTFNSFRTKDGRTGWAVDESGRLCYVLTEPELMDVAGIYDLTSGYYGDILEAENEALLLYVTGNGSIAQLVGDAGAWPVSFTDSKPIPSDSQVTRLRARIYGDYSFAAWRSRGQHRLMVQDKSEVMQEMRQVVNGSLTLSLDTPVVSCSLEFETDEYIPPTFAVTFMVVDEFGLPVVGADIVISEKTAKTDAEGKAVLQVPFGTHQYIVSKDSLLTVVGKIKVEDKRTVEIIMTKHFLVITFRVTYGQLPLTGAKVTVGPEVGYTDTEGLVTVTMELGAYGYSVEYEGYETVTGTVDEEDHYISVNMAGAELPTGVHYWLDASQILAVDGQELTTLPDFGGKGFTGVPVIDETSPNKPVYQQYGMKGKPAVLFNNAYISLAEDIQLGSPYTMFIVAEVPSSVAGNRQWFCFGEPSFGIRASEADICYLGYYNSQSTAHITLDAVSNIPNNLPMLVATRRSEGKNIFITINGEEGVLANRATYWNSASPCISGRSETIMVAEVILYDRALGDTELSQVHWYLDNKYGLPVSRNAEPDELPGCVLWLDAAQGVTKDANNKVSSWQDRSGAGNDATASGSTMPGWVENGINNLPAMDFDGHHFVLPNSLLRDVEGADVFFVHVNPAGAATHYQTLVVALQGENGSGNRLQMRFNSSSDSGRMVFGGIRLDTESWQNVYSTAEQFSLQANTNYITNGIFDYNNALLTAKSNGKEIATNSSFQTKGRTSDTDSQGIWLGNNMQDATRKFVGQIAEVIIYNRRLAHAERLQLENYLADKYGIALERD